MLHPPVPAFRPPAHWRCFLALVGGLLGFGPAHLAAAPLPFGNPARAAASPRLPEPAGPPGYVSSQSCSECHREQHDSWFHSYHRSMTQAASTNTVVADFNDAVLTFNEERFTLRHRGNVFWVEVQDISPSATPGPPTQLPMELVTGSHHMQVFWVPAGAGNAQVGFPFTWLIPERRWVPRESTFIRDPHSPQQVETWNMTCIRCHVTGGQPRPRRDQGIFSTRATELGIACESCHGPAADHVAFRRGQLAATNSAPATPSAPGPALSKIRAPANSARDTNDPIVLPTRLDHVRASHVCAQCHAMKWFDSSENWVENGFRYRPGDDLEASTPIIRPGSAESQPWMKKVLERAPQILTEFFWSDGMIRVAGREYNGLLETPCHQKGRLSCLTCHSLHDYAQANDQLKKGMDGDRACSGCHAPANYGTAHTHHAAGSTGSLCYNCHMPHTTYALLGGIRQHQIDSPRLAATLKTGRPDACTLCHIDRTLAWADEKLSTWYGHPRATLSEEQKSLSATARLLLVGDAGQRALAAWHLGWEPARAIGGSDWQAPLLARVLRDPYAAVRRIAHRSLVTLPGHERTPFDFVAPDEELASASVRVLRNWKPTTTARAPGAAKAVLLRPDGQSDEKRADQLLGQRDDRPMRLRE